MLFEYTRGRVVPPCHLDVSIPSIGRVWNLLGAPTPTRLQGSLQMATCNTPYLQQRKHALAIRRYVHTFLSIC